MFVFCGGGVTKLTTVWIASVTYCQQDICSLKSLHMHMHMHMHWIFAQGQMWTGICMQCVSGSGCECGCGEG